MMRKEQMKIHVSRIKNKEMGSSRDPEQRFLGNKQF